MKKLLSSMYFRIGLVGVIAVIIGFAGSLDLFKNRPITSAKNCQDICVALTKDGIMPDSLAVKVGQYVQFNSADGQLHNLGLGGGEDGDHAAHESEHEHVGDFTSGDFKADEAWRVQFKQPGTFKFHDHYNPKLNILVVVYEPKQ